MEACNNYRSKFLCFFLVIAFILLPGGELAQAATLTQTGTIVNCTSVNVRSGPGSGYAKLGSALKGQTFPVLGTSGSWIKISFNGKTGYIYKDYIKVTTQTAPVSSTTRTGVVVNCTSYVNVRSGPGTGYSKIGTAPKGATYTVTGQTGSWYKVIFNGRTGYIYANYLLVKSTSAATPTPVPTVTPVVTKTPAPTPTPTSSILPTASAPSPTSTPTSIAATPTSQTTPTPNGTLNQEQASGTKMLAGYYASWAAYSGFTPLSIKATNLTHIFYAFANIGPDLKVQIGDAAIDTSNFAKLRELKAQYPKLKTLISIGGWTWSSRFSDAALTEASREAFAQSAIDFMKQNGFDGIDLDWEYPVGGGLTSNVVRPEDKANFTLLIAKIREKLDEREALDGCQYLLSFAGAAGFFYADNTELGKLSNYVDFATIMTYDMHGPWEGSYTDFNAPLFTPKEASPQYQWSCDDAVKLWTGKGFNKSKIIMGIPFYGVKFTGVANANHGLYQTFSSGSTLSYDKIMSSYANNAAYTSFMHADALVPWLFNGSTFISYDDIPSISQKGAYIDQMDLGGAVIWELSQNADGALIEALDANMNK